MICGLTWYLVDRRGPASELAEQPASGEGRDSAGGAPSGNGGCMRSRVIEMGSTLSRVWRAVCRWLRRLARRQRSRLLECLHGPQRR